MYSHSGDAFRKVKNDPTGSQQLSKRKQQNSLDVVPVDSEYNNNRSIGSSSNQLVLYNPVTSDPVLEVVPSIQPSNYRASSTPCFSAPDPSIRVLPSVGAFTVQCASCMKWRLVPTKEKYEEIRENVLREPFFCERAQEWRPNVSCTDPPDISPDDTRLWAMDKPNIAQPPPGWERLLRIRGEGSTKFADVYYAAPSGKRLRSMVEIRKFLLEHPEYSQDVSISQFSFQIPKPLQENYVRKRTAPLAFAGGGGGPGMPRLIEPDEVNLLQWTNSFSSMDMQIKEPGQSTSSTAPISPSPPAQPSLKKKKKNVSDSPHKQSPLKKKKNVSDSPPKQPPVKKKKNDSDSPLKPPPLKNKKIARRPRPLQEHIQRCSMENIPEIIAEESPQEGNASDG